MNIVKLTSIHQDAIKPLFFTKEKFMGSSSFVQNDKDFNQKLYEIFCDTYLSDLENYHAFGAFNEETNTVEACMSFYESVTDPSWYSTVARSLGNNLLLKDILDSIMAHNEANGRLKFFTVMNARQARLIRKFCFSDAAKERYDYFDEYTVSARHRAFYSDHWELLYRRSLLQVDTVVRCTFLKREYRTNLPNGGNI